VTMRDGALFDVVWSEWRHPWFPAMTL